MVNTMGWNERSDPDMRTANFCDVYREGVYICTLYDNILKDHLNIAGRLSLHKLTKKKKK